MTDTTLPQPELPATDCWTVTRALEAIHPANDTPVKIIDFDKLQVKYPEFGYPEWLSIAHQALLAANALSAELILAHRFTGARVTVTLDISCEPLTLTIEPR